MDINLLTPVAIIAALILYIIGEKTYKFYVFYQRINKIPGPNYWIPFFGAPYEIMRLKREDQLSWFENTFNQYKGCMRMWVGFSVFVHLYKPDLVEGILRSVKQIGKGEVYRFLTPWLGQGILTSTGAQWFHSRKLITPTFHFSILEGFSEVMIDKVNIFNECLERAIKKNGNKPFDIFELCLNSTLDVLCETAMGVNIHAQDEVENEYRNSIKAVTFGIMERILSPWLALDFIYFKLPSGKAFKKAVKISLEFCERLINRKQQERNLAAMGCNKAEGNVTDKIGQHKKKAFLDLLLEANEKEENQSKMSIEELRDQTNTFMFAGHDTTGALVSWTIFCLGNELDVQQKVHEELDQVLGNLNDRDTLKQMSNVKYLERVIKETLRLYPTVPTIGRTITEDMQIGDYIVPKGANIHIQVRQLHRDASVWPDPLRFDPDRFLPENSKGRSHYAFLPFSAGPRNCIGQKYAMLEAKIMLAQVLRKFSVKSVETHETIKNHNSIVLRPTGGIYVHMKKRF